MEMPRLLRAEARLDENARREIERVLQRGRPAALVHLAIQHGRGARYEAEVHASFLGSLDGEGFRRFARGYHDFGKEGGVRIILRGRSYRKENRDPEDRHPDRTAQGRRIGCHLPATEKG